MVFPAPFCPRRANNSPARICKSKPLNFPPPAEKAFLTNCGDKLTNCRKEWTKMQGNQKGFAVKARNLA